LQPSNAIWWTQIEQLNFEWLMRNQYILNWSGKFTIQTRRESANFPTIFIEFGHWMQTLQHFELNLKLCEAFFETLGHWGFKQLQALSSWCEFKPYKWFYMNLEKIYEIKLMECSSYSNLRNWCIPKFEYFNCNFRPITTTSWFSMYKKTW